ncbi:hypothetical protein U9M48_036350 [Paspalum notatum var. saurae]|uniref:Uncharacterized protein n=1 Tax=Paspalum notatum var. saurae TaxID=547442 RepID=A0AAQ3XB15_PASNO
MQYVQSFIQLSQYAPEDTHLGRRYESFTDLVDSTLDMESHLCIANEDQKCKRQANSAPASSSQKPRANYQQPQRFSQQSRFVVRPTQPGWIHRALQ